MEVVLETFKLRTTNSVYDNDEVLLWIYVLLFAVTGILSSNGVNQLVLVRMFSKTGAVKYVCYWLGLESCVLVLLPKVLAVSLIDLELLG
jgi:hypothetical protein